MENLKEETTCHIEALKNHDFGGTLNNINGGLECPAYHGGWHGEAIKMRLNRYCRATEVLGLDTIMIMDGCKLLNESFAECLGDGTCPVCEQFADGIQPLAPSHGEEDESNTLVEESLTEEVETTVLETTPVATTISAVTTEIRTKNPTSSSPSASPTTISPTLIATEQTDGNDTDSSTTTSSTSTVTGTAVADTTTTSTGVDTTVAEITTPVATTTTPAPSCPDGLQSVEGMPSCCLPEIAYLGDGACDPDFPYNTPECNFDGGDCCRETCNFDSNYGCANEASQGYGPFGYFCLNPELDEYVNPNECTVADRTRLGDGKCDADYNTEECNWDGGDCCESTCDPDYAYFECGQGGYDCKNEAETVLAETTTTVSPPETTLITSTDFSSTTSAMYVPSDPSLRVTVEASQIATIFKNDPDTPHGDETLQIRGTSFGPNAQDVLMRFVVPASESDPTSATLRVYSLSNSDSGGIFHIVPESSAWSDKTVTWNSAPDYTGRLGNLDQIEENKWYEIDITSEIAKLNRKRGPISVRIRSRNPGTAEYGSRNSSNPPELKIAYPLSEPNVQPEAPSEVVVIHTPIAEGLDNASPPKQDYTTSNIVNIAPSEKYISIDEYLNSDDGSHYYPVWEANGNIQCTTGQPPNWATGPYLKKTKRQCCDAYFNMKKNECMST
jgi:hypothetical protein